MAKKTPEERAAKQLARTERDLPYPIGPDVVAHLLEQAERMRGHHSMNGYRCDQCDVTELTIDIDLGVTPASIRCPHCGRGRAMSLGYPAEELPPEALPQQEWYRPTRGEFATLTQWERDHVRQGGLLHRQYTAKRPGAYTELGFEARRTEGHL